MNQSMENHQPSLQQQVETIKKDMQEAFAQNIQRASELNRMPRPVDPELQSVFVMSLLEGVLSRWLFQSVDDEWRQLEIDEIDELVEKNVQFEFFGLFGV
ncbi:hypothetical protein MHB48_07125 [Psychrobacillus sp. FSL H8-0483]|uniref:hypothetical protein n=1 Tax=Psychrobacillus sp. FSL H8-0483 TaxID=2921389 RepID=UPI00315AFE37